MGRYSDIRQTINSQAQSFGLYIDHRISEAGISQLFNYVAERGDVYVFSGIIRNFLLGYLENRDIDFVISMRETLNIPIRFLRGSTITKNKFGGVKIQKNGFNIDVWNIGSTWSVDTRKGISSPYSLLKTAFFNFSSIVYDYHKRKFIYDDTFCRFKEYNIVDVVNVANPFPSACVVSTLHYAATYEFEIGDKLRRWIVKHYDQSADFVNIQKKRYGTVLYDHSTIDEFVNACKATKNSGEIQIKDSNGETYRIIIHKNIKI